MLLVLLETKVITLFPVLPSVLREEAGATAEKAELGGKVGRAQGAKARGDAPVGEPQPDLGAPGLAFFGPARNRGSQLQRENCLCRFVRVQVLTRGPGGRVVVKCARCHTF